MKVLVADDRADFLRTLEDLFRDQGNEVVTAHDGLDAHMILHESEHQRKPFDLVLCDIKMPWATGIRLYRYFQPLHRKTAWVLMTNELDISCQRLFQDRDHVRILDKRVVIGLWRQGEDEELNLAQTLYDLATNRSPAHVTPSHVCCED